ncbi:permease prefix domain 1-containing protein [Halobacillus amylolyticus]|uniref:Permease prefix domain 1-containing protein n=1 Tax=Halobacillus amylolyticus TaxID=2932259 RepID=A0ABY4H7H9_9BACI|nr:permease prefix domain 1-containing protein [Halobacillus amylolyticus]UOR10549.1 permease prefix domain 1-containing protein [Halobacillus amylolyticus]
MNRIEKHVDRILEQMQSPPEEREDIKEELMSHLQTAKLHYMEDGVPEKKAEKQAIDDFGKPDTIGHGFQETIYPYQRSLLYGIGIATLIFGAILYISLTFGVGKQSLSGY